jgi:hypothetical protein
VQPRQLHEGAERFGIQAEGLFELLNRLVHAVAVGVGLPGKEMRTRIRRIGRDCRVRVLEGVVSFVLAESERAAHDVRGGVSRVLREELAQPTLRLRDLAVRGIERREANGRWRDAVRFGCEVLEHGPRFGLSPRLDVVLREGRLRGGITGRGNRLEIGLRFADASARHVKDAEGPVCRHVLRVDGEGAFERRLGILRTPARPIEVGEREAG